MIYACEDTGIFVGGVSRPNGEKTALKTFLYVCLWVFRPQIYFTVYRGGSNGFIAEKTMLFQGIRGGSTFRGVHLFTGGIQMLISIKNRYNL